VLTNNGKIIHTGSGSLALPFGTSLVNNGFYDLQGDASVGGQQGGTFQNNGMFIKSQGTGTSTNNNWVNTSTGPIDLEPRKLTLTGSFANNGTGCASCPWVGFPHRVVRPAAGRRAWRRPAGPAPSRRAYHPARARPTCRGENPPKYGTHTQRHRDHRCGGDVPGT